MALGILIGVALTVLVFIVGVGVLSRRRTDRRMLPDGFDTYVSGALMIAAAVALVVCIRALSVWMARASNECGARSTTSPPGGSAPCTPALAARQRGRPLKKVGPGLWQHRGRFLASRVKALPVLLTRSRASSGCGFASRP